MLSLPYGGLVAAPGTTTQTLTTSNALFTQWSAVSQADSNTFDGDVAIRPDLSNNRLLVQAGGGKPNQQTVGARSSIGSQGAAYLVHCSGNFLGGGTDTVTISLRKNGTVQSDLSTVVYTTTAIQGCFSFSGILLVQASDCPGTIDTMASPSGTFTGGSGAPKTECAVDIVMKAASGVTLTFTNVALTLLRVG